MWQPNAATRPNAATLWHLPHGGSGTYRGPRWVGGTVANATLIEDIQGHEPATGRSQVRLSQVRLSQVRGRGYPLSTVDHGGSQMHHYGSVGATWRSTQHATTREATRVGEAHNTPHGTYRAIVG